MHTGLGPSFGLEIRLATRRWQGYALRSLFVVLLAASGFFVLVSELSQHPWVSFRTAGLIGEALFYGMVSTELVLVMLVAPAATAGAICLDRARGTLAHILTTDLSSAEIILGKLAARLGPVLGLVAAALPVTIAATLLGGIDPTALVGAALIAVGLALFGCALALALSLEAGKTHEAVFGTYLAWAL